MRKASIHLSDGYALSVCVKIYHLGRQESLYRRPTRIASLLRPIGVCDGRCLFWFGGSKPSFGESKPSFGDSKPSFGGSKRKASLPSTSKGGQTTDDGCAQKTHSRHFLKREAAGCVL
ncbi:hypothetical protein [uncultured Alloprevotella sp.]|uniref:hypothetical protein n=1 Tax=uncultured Alloprevotella sp. TaxID=1283315 RepID=UPI00261D64F6|nr:hypothetical protein [uncultured Alloprevotella sp.]